MAGTQVETHPGMRGYRSTEIGVEIAVKSMLTQAVVRTGRRTQQLAREQLFLLRIYRHRHHRAQEQSEDNMHWKYHFTPFHHLVSYTFVFLRFFKYTKLRISPETDKETVKFLLKEAKKNEKRVKTSAKRLSTWIFSPLFPTPVHEG